MTGYASTLRIQLEAGSCRHKPVFLLRNTMSVQFAAGSSEWFKGEKPRHVDE